MEGCKAAPHGLAGRHVTEKTNHRQRWLLRARSERPSSSCAAKEQDELSAFDVGHGDFSPGIRAVYRKAQGRSLGQT
jgi:hypothetical protein